MASITKRVTTAGTSWRIQIRRQGEAPIFRTARTKGEAQEIARKLERDLDEGKKIIARTMTVARLIDRYLEDLGTTFETMKQHPTMTPSKTTSLAHIRRLLGPVEIRDLDNRKIVQFAQDRRDFDPGRNGAPLSAATIAMDIGYLGALLGYGARNFNTPNRIEALGLARQDLRERRLVAKSRTVARLPSDADFAKMLAAAAGLNRQQLPLDTILKIARATGMRESELCRVRWRDLDADARVLNVPLRKHPRGPYDKEMPLIPNHGIDPLEEILALKGLRRPGQDPDDDRIIPYEPGTIGAAFRKLLKRAGLRRIRLHDLRHDAATALARRKDLHFQGAMLVLGHDDVKSLNRYTHLTAAEIARSHGFPASSAPAPSPARRRGRKSPAPA
jgi:integrase